MKLVWSVLNLYLCCTCFLSIVLLFNLDNCIWKFLVEFVAYLWVSEIKNFKHVYCRSYVVFLEIKMACVCRNKDESRLLAMVWRTLKLNNWHVSCKDVQEALKHSRCLRLGWPGQWSPIVSGFRWSWQIEVLNRDTKLMSISSDDDDRTTAWVQGFWCVRDGWVSFSICKPVEWGG